MRKCWSIAEVVVLGVTASCVLLTGCDEHRDGIHRHDHRPSREVIIVHDQEVEHGHERDHHDDHDDDDD